MNRERIKKAHNSRDLFPVEGPTSRGRSYGSIGSRMGGALEAHQRLQAAAELVRLNQVPALGGGHLGRKARELQFMQAAAAGQVSL